MKASTSVIAVDVGNSAVKVLVWKSGHPDDNAQQEAPHKTFALSENNWQASLCDWVDGQTQSGAMDWLVCTVNRSASDPLEQTVLHHFYRQSGGATTWQAFRYDDVPMVAAVDFPARLGLDRLMGAFAASTQFPGSLVVVDVGSAVTVDFVSRDASGQAVFEGGAILPGIRLQREALTSGTEALDAAAPDSVMPPSPVLVPAKTTEDAIRTGILASIGGAIDRLAEDYASDERGDVRVVVTGGDAAIISSCLQTPHQHVPNLVCNGLVLCQKNLMRTGISQPEA